MWLSVINCFLWGQVRHAEMHSLSAWSKSCFVLWSSEKVRLALYIWLCISWLWPWFCLWHNNILYFVRLWVQNYELGHYHYHHHHYYVHLIGLNPTILSWGTFHKRRPGGRALKMLSWAWFMCSRAQSTGGIEAAVPHQGSGLPYCHFIVCDYMADIKVGKPVRWLLLVLSKFKKKKQA